MKKYSISLILIAAAIVSGCYEDYLMDYPYTAAYTPYQYDLRTFVYGEDVKVSFTSALAGITNNDKDRDVEMTVDNSLLDTDLSKYDVKGETSTFYAIDGLLGNGGIGSVSQAYVSQEVSAAGISSLEALPEDYYTLNVQRSFEKGRHTAKIGIAPTERMFQDPKILKPYYALGFVIVDADVDTVIADKSFQIMVVKVENRFWGTWYHGGRTTVRRNVDGSIISDERYSRVLPQADSRCYTLTTESFNSVTTNKIGAENGSLRLVFNEDDGVTVEDPSGARDIRPVQGKPSHHNGAKLIQDREIYLSYSWSNNDGTSTYVTDTLAFRNRIRDGVNEWQDENTENYQ